MKKLSKYGYHFVYSSAMCADENFRKYDGKSFDRMDEAINFLLEHYNGNSNEIMVMVWQEYFDEFGNIIDTECVDDIFVEDLMEV